MILFRYFQISNDSSESRNQNWGLDIITGVNSLRNSRYEMQRLDDVERHVFYGALAQRKHSLVQGYACGFVQPQEHWAYNPEIRGSIPLGSCYRF